MKICIPSSNRANKITSNFIKNSIVFVPENQYQEYKISISNKVISVPNDFYGITKTRNFILNYFKGEDILFIDDDVKECGFFNYGNRVNLKRETHTKEWNDIFQKCFETTRQLGFDLFGVENGGSKFSNHVFKPILFKGSINGTILGVTKECNLMFDESYIVKEDFEFVLRSFYEKGGFCKFNYFYWRTKHWGNAGGCVDYRTNEIEQSAINRLKSKYGFNIQTGKGKNKYHTTLKF